MKNKLVNRLSFGATVTVFLYVAGFLWQYSYLASITDHVGWIKIVTVDYLYLGVMALVFTVEPWLFSISAVLFIFYYSGLMSFTVKRVWLLLSFEMREKLWLMVNNSRFDDYDFNIRLSKFIFYVYVLVVLFTLPTSIIDTAKAHLAYRLSSEPTDILCEREGDCYQGKILYTSDKQFYFYTYEGSSDYRGGRLLVVGINNASVNLVWNPKAKAKIDKIVDAKSEG